MTERELLALCASAQMTRTLETADAIQRARDIINIAGLVPEPEPEPETTPSIIIDKCKATVDEGMMDMLTATVTPADAEVTWSVDGDGAYATVVSINNDNIAIVTGVAEGSAIVTASITVGETTYEDVCVVTVAAAPVEA